MSTDRKLELVEPTFVLRAGDPVAQSLIKQWARRHELALAKGIVTPGIGPAEIKRARDIIPIMEEWAQRDAVRRYHEVIAKFSKRFPGGRQSAEVIKLKRPE
jgi:hypothetical protein